MSVMDPEALPENPYLLLTPGPLSTSPTVKAAMLRDWCTWDADYNKLVQEIRAEIPTLAALCGNTYTAVLMQGSGTFAVESVIGTAVPRDGKVLVVANGAYGERIVKICQRLGIQHTVERVDELTAPDDDRVAEHLEMDPALTHVAVVHCETTTGMLNPVEAIGRRVAAAGRAFIVDAMSSFGALPIDFKAAPVDFLVSSANKCIQGVPGFGFVLAKRTALLACEGRARSLSLDLFDQWSSMEAGDGKWRYTSPTHTVRAFRQALAELREEGGPPARLRRYSENHTVLVAGMEDLGFRTLLPPDLQAPIITGFHDPGDPAFHFDAFYHALKRRGFVIYPGKVTNVESFRIGNIGHVFPDDMRRMVQAVRETVREMGLARCGPVHEACGVATGRAMPRQHR